MQHSETEDETVGRNRQDGSRKQARFKRSSQACQHCRHLKMKCSGTVPCERCLRHGRECEETNRPTRGSWSRKKDLQIQTLTKRLEEMEQSLERRAAAQRQQQPLLSLAAQPLQNQNNPRLLSMNTIAEEGTLTHLPFIQSGILSTQEASKLFNIFMQHCCHHVPLLDVEWHTLTLISNTCPFLFACIVNVAANYDNSRLNLRWEMQEEMNTLIGRIITSGQKSVGIIQAFLILYFWNQPCTDMKSDLAWTYSGLALRMAVDINLASSAKGATKRETERERINRERTWMFCFLVDRTQSAARGKKWSLHGNDVIVGNACSWYSQKISRCWDLGIAALADLLKSRQIDVFNDCLLLTGTSLSEGNNISFQCETTMRLLNNELQQWKKRWYSRGFFTSPLEEGGELGVQPTMDIHTRTLHYITRQAYLRFYYAVLVLNCAGLQYHAIHPEITEGKTYVLVHAMQAAQEIVTAAKDGLQETVAYSPQTQCTIISFAIISLIKMAPLMRSDPLISDRLIQLATSGIAFLDSVSLQPTHVPARCASMLRGLLRKSSQQNEAATAFQPGMDELCLPIRSSRAVTPSAADTDSTPSHGLTLSTPLAATIDNTDLCSENTPTNFTLFGMDGTTGLGQMTAEQILDESFWLCLAPFSPSTQHPVP